jgi:hypothetical protein
LIKNEGNLGRISIFLSLFLTLTLSSATWEIFFMTIRNEGIKHFYGCCWPIPTARKFFSFSSLFCVWMIRNWNEREKN